MINSRFSKVFIFMYFKKVLWYLFSRLPAQTQVSCLIELEFFITDVSDFWGKFLPFSLDLIPYFQFHPFMEPVAQTAALS